MEIIDYASELLKLSKEETQKNSKKLDDNLTYYWNPVRGGISVIVDNKGNYLTAVSNVNFDELIEEFKKGDRNKNFFHN
ncbi:MAG: hypothetical protein IKE75_06180 [Bacilli bacterium]|nr:hypothetical protein [Bacilli bacterium]